MANTASIASKQETVWDPFVGSRPAVRQSVEAPKAGMGIPPWVGQTFLVLALVGFVLAFGAVVWSELIPVAVALIVVSFAGVIGVDKLNKTKDQREWRFFQIAQANGWSFRLVEPERRSQSGKRTIVRVDPLASDAYKHVEVLCSPRPGQLIPLRFQAMYWGQTAQGVPFWLGIQEYEVDASLAVEALKKDGFGNRSTSGKLFNMIASYRLDRDTGVVATLLAEAMDRDGWQDVKTESVEFNSRFKIAVAHRAEPDGAPEQRPDSGQMTLELARILTPATQAMLIELDDRYKLQVLIDHDTVHFNGTDRIMSEEETAVATHFQELVQRFAQAAFSIKRYVE